MFGSKEQPFWEQKVKVETNILENASAERHFSARYLKGQGKLFEALNIFKTFCVEYIFKPQARCFC